MADAEPELMCERSVPGEVPSRRESSRRLRREAILDVAARSFLEHGYAATSMSAIAAELGGSKGTLWSYFPGKQPLFAAVLDRATEAFQQQLALLLNPHDDLATTLRRFARGFLQRVTSAEALALHRLVLAEVKRFPETGRIFYDRATGRTQAQLAAYLSGAMARGQLRSADPLLAARQLLALCLSGSHQMLLIRLIDVVDGALIAQDASVAVTTFMHAYGTSGGDTVGLPGVELSDAVSAAKNRGDPTQLSQ